MEIWIIVLVAILVAIICFLAFYFTTKKNKNISIENPIEINNTDKVEENKISIPKIEKPITTEITSSIQQKVKVSEPINEEQIIFEEEEDKLQLNISISSKTEKEILRKLELFEKNKGFIKKDINLNSLAKQFETNTKYLSEIIKTHRQRQFNNYLNDLRINYIVNRLQTEPKYINTKISYLASDSGFSSHSTFTTIFTQIMNESPSIFIKRVKAEQKEV